jgi:hypothetical protein
MAAFLRMRGCRDCGFDRLRIIQLRISDCGLRIADLKMSVVRGQLLNRFTELATTTDDWLIRNPKSAIRN